MKKTLTILIILSCTLVTGHRSLAQTFGNAINLDGIDDYAIVPHHTSLNPGEGSWTVSYWLKAADIPQKAPVVMKRLPQDGYTMYSFGFGNIDPHNPELGRRVRVNYIEDAGVIERSGYTPGEYIDGNWHHYVIVADKIENGIVVYVDGEIVDFTQMYELGAWPNVENEEDLYICRSNSGASIQGVLDELSIWRKALDQGEVQQLMYDTLSPAIYTTPESGLVAYYRFDEWNDLGVGAGGLNDIRDLSSYSNHMGTEGLPLLGPSLTLTGLVERDRSFEFELYPNPAKDIVRIRYQIPDAGYQMIGLFGIDGRKIRRISEEKVQPGEHEVLVDVSDLPAGVYFVRVQAGERVGVRKLIISD